ncbi:MAG: hypothetical protein K2X48_18115 [Chitinophagaceae bacterium]|nr:hypothetical protein [Chitinophagaceae bacterium]
MLRLILLFTTLSAASFVQGQKKKSVELDFIGRYDKHADYTTRFYDRTYTNDTKLRGYSYGANLNFLQPLTQKLKLKIGAGYYQLGVGKIEQTTRVNTIVPARTIDYNHPTGVQPLFATDYYKYDNLALSGGIIYEQNLKGQWNYFIGMDFSYLYTFSQLYNITYDNSKYRTNNGKTLGFGVNSYLGVMRSFHKDKYYINPKIIIPLYQQLRADQVFGEDNSIKMKKWLNGTGLSLSIGKYF